MTINTSDDNTKSVSSSSSLPRRGRILRRGSIGVMARDGACLMIRRAAHIALGGKWCFPGGHIEAGENSMQAVCREFREELNVDVKPLKKLGYIRLEDIGYLLAVWQVAHLGGKIRPLPSEVSETKWVLIDKITTVSPGVPSNRNVYEMIKKADQSLPTT